jgi:acetyl-CoA C-acetyltransferase
LPLRVTGLFDAEIAPVEIAQRKGPALVVAKDEEPERGVPKKFPELRPAFKPDGTITAANASSVNDGAAALVLASERAVQEMKLTPLARLIADGVAAHAPEWFTTAPAKAITAALGRAKLGVQDIDFWEVNEAFACVPMACARLAGIDSAKLNVRGGAVALGHPIGASGARVLTTLLHTLGAKQRGAASLCIGGGEGIAVVVERH